MSYTLTLTRRGLVATGATCRLADRDAISRACPKCGQEAGWPCTYTRAGGIHRDRSTGEYARNVPGNPMLRVHPERRRAPC